MRINGTLQYQILTPGKVNEFGEPTPAKVEWSEPVECQITTNSDNRKGVYEDGEFRMASFLVHLEARHSKDFERIRLVRHTENLGEYRIMSREPLTSVGRIKIMV